MTPPASRDPEMLIASASTLSDSVSFVNCRFPILVLAMFNPPIAMYSLKLVVLIVIVPELQDHRLFGTKYQISEPVPFFFQISRLVGHAPAPSPNKLNCTVTADANVVPCGVNVNLFE